MGISDPYIKQTKNVLVLINLIKDLITTPIIYLIKCAHAEINSE